MDSKNTGWGDQGHLNFFSKQKEIFLLMASLAYLIDDNEAVYKTAMSSLCLLNISVSNTRKE